MNFQTTSHERRLGYILAFGALIWGGTFNALAKGLTPYLSPVALLLISESLTALFIILTFGLVPLYREFKKMDAKSIGLSVLFGLVQSAIVPLLWFNGLARTSAINASILGNADMVFMLVFSWMIFRERVGRLQIIGVIVVILGILIINFSPSGVATGVHIGDALILLGALFTGIGAVFFKKYLSHVMPELAIAIRNVSGIIVVLGVSLFLPYTFMAEVAAFPMEKVLLLLAFAFFSRYLNLMFFYGGLDRLPATTFSFIELGGPLSGLVFASLLLGEQIHSYQLLGGIFIVFGMALEQLSSNALDRLRHRSFLSHFHVPWHRQHEQVLTPMLVPGKV
ncbi:MAG: DMT family transporter [Candidatus Peribacteraceae bacterium]|nr:DMT family transporter [Candidatus Peribacteraceae bacterium]